MLPQVTPDGRFLLYAARADNDSQPRHYKANTYTLMRIPIGGGTPEEVPIGGCLDEFRCALNPAKRCVLRTTEGGHRTFFDLDPIKGKGRELAQTDGSFEYLGNWDISADGTHVPIPNHDPRSARIRVVTLEPGPREAREHEVILPGIVNLRGLVWAADGKSWFVSVDTTVGRRLLYVGLDGHSRPLGDIIGWGRPLARRTSCSLLEPHHRDRRLDD